MSYLIFCSFEVGGLPYKVAEILNQHGVETYYISLQRKKIGHDSKQFHFGDKKEKWDLSSLFNDVFNFSVTIVIKLSQIKEKYNIANCFATGSKSYLLKQAGINYKYWSYGSDLDQWCFYPVWPPNYPLWKKLVRYPYFMLIDRPQPRKSICKADSIMIAPYQIKSLNQICPSKELFFLPHFLEILDYQTLLQKKRVSKKLICEKIQAKHFFFSSTRHFWAGHHSEMSDNKGNDVILHSFTQYLKVSNDSDAKLVLVEKGPDVEASKFLAQKLGIDQYIVWVNEMRREVLNKYYQGATLCFGQFGTPVITFAAVEPLANANICISFFGENHSIIPFYEKMPPIINSKSPVEIGDFMSRLVKDSDYYDAMCYKSWSWMKENCSEKRFVEKFLGLFQQT